MRMFPILISTWRVKDEIDAVRDFGSPYMCVCLPWDMIAPHERQAQKNHSQTLARLAERGGLGADEAIAVLEDREWRSMKDGQAHHDLCKMVAAWVTEQLYPEPG